MRENRRNGRVPTKTSVEEEIAHLRGLDLKGLRARWHSVFQRPAPAHLPRHLLFAIIAYRIQADRLGDLDHETMQVLDRTDSKETAAAMSARLVSFDPGCVKMVFLPQKPHATGDDPRRHDGLRIFLLYRVRSQPGRKLGPR